MSEISSNPRKSKANSSFKQLANVGLVGALLKDWRIFQSSRSHFFATRCRRAKRLV